MVATLERPRTAANPQDLQPVQQTKPYHVGNMGELVQSAAFSRSGSVRITRDELLGMNENTTPERSKLVGAVPGLLSEHIIATGAEALIVTFYGVAKAQTGEETVFIDIPRQMHGIVSSAPARSENG